LKMKKRLIFLLLIFATTIFGQTKPKKTITNLAPVNVCGGVKYDSAEIYSGVSMKRDYSKEDETTLVGFVLKNKDDDRTYFNIDSDYVSNKGHYSLSELSQTVRKGSRLKVFAYRCRKILYVHKIQKL